MAEHRRHLILIWAEYLFLAFLGVYLFFLALGTTTFDLQLPGKTERILLYAIAATSAMRIVLLLLLDPEKRKDHLRMFLFAILVALVWFRVWRSIHLSFLRFLAVLTVGAIGVSYRNALKIFVISVGLTVMTAVVCGRADLITNLVYLAPPRLRSSWGIVYPTDFASILIFLCVIAWAAWPEVPDRFFLVPGAVVLLASRFIAESNTSVVCSVLFLFLVLLHMGLSIGIFSKLQRLIDFCACAAFPIFASHMVGLAWLYKQGNILAQKIDALSHSRLSNAVDAYDLYGLNLFGAPLEQIGNGASIIPRPGYNFVDSTYLLILLRYGVVIFLIIILLWVLMSRKAARSGDRRLLFALALIAFHSISEHHFTEVNYNILLILPFSVLVQGTDRVPLTAAESPRENILSHIWQTVAAALIIPVFMFIMPKALSVFRTFCAIKGLNSASLLRFRILFLGVFTGFAFLFLLLFILWRMIAGCLTQRRFGRKEKVFSILCLLFAAAGIFGLTFLFRSEYPRWQELIEADRPAIEVLRKAENCSLYVSEVPELYQDTYGGISAAYGGVEDLARLQDIAVITDSDFDSNVLIGTGFLYTPISEKHAVYTNSVAAAQALTDAGFHMTGYYSSVRSVDMKWLSWRNGLETRDDGTAILNADHPLKHGPYVTLFNYAYTITFDLALIVEESKTALERMNEEDPAFLLRVASDFGQRIILERTVLLKEFLEGEVQSISVTSMIPERENVEFLILNISDGLTFLLHDLRWQKTPAYDIHRVYDRSWHLIHDSFYDHDGAPMTMSGGFQGRDLEFDDKGNMLFARYLDDNGIPVMVSGEYAEIRREYDGKNLITESYYNTEGKSVNIRAGYAALRNEYTKDGELSLTYYTDNKGTPVELGSAYLHSFLQSLKDQDLDIFISFKGDAASNLTVTLTEDLMALGATMDLRSYHQQSYLLVITPEGVIEELSEGPLTYSGQIDGLSYTIESAGLDVGDRSSIVINGEEFSKNVRGLNIVIVQGQTVIDSVSFDTGTQEMRVTR